MALDARPVWHEVVAAARRAMGGPIVIADPGTSNLARLAILAKQLGDIARCVVAGDVEALRRELAQERAVLDAWGEALD